MTGRRLKWFGHVRRRLFEHGWRQIMYDCMLYLMTVKPGCKVISPTTVWFVDMTPPRERNTDYNVDIICYEQKREKCGTWKKYGGRQKPVANNHRCPLRRPHMTGQARGKVKSSSRQSALGCLEGLPRSTGQ